MPKTELICYENLAQYQYTLRPEKELLSDFLPLAKASLQRKTSEAVVLKSVVSSNEEFPQPQAQVRDIPLHSLLEHGAVVLALVCLLSLISWVANVQPLVIINPFAALLGLVMSPFLYLM